MITLILTWVWIFWWLNDFTTIQIVCMFIASLFFDAVTNN